MSCCIKDVGLYYQSIIGTAAHSLIGSLALFVGQIAHFTQDGRDYSELLSYLTPEFGLADSVLNDIAAFSALQERVDSACIEVIESMSDFARVEELRVGEGVSFKRSVSHLILGMLHHSTHHRGQIAGALDMLGVENDFAGALLGME